MDADTEDTGPSLRESLESALTTGPADAPAPVEAAPEAPEAPDDAPEKAEKPPRPRTETGQFAKGSPEAKEAAAKAAAAPGKAGVAAPAKPPPTAAVGAPTATPDAKAGREPKPPQSWKPDAREHWAALPAEVKAEVARRDRETAQALEASAEARKGYEAFRATVGPFEAMIRAEGGEPLRAVQNLLHTAQALRTAPPQHKAQLVADIVRSFGVPIEALDAALAGQPQPPQPQRGGPQQFQDPRLDALLQQMQQGQQQRQEALQQNWNSQAASFSESHEFFEDVRESMAKLIEVGFATDYEDAYTKACNLSPEISKVVTQREKAANAQTGMASTQKARAAASTVRGKPTNSVAAGGSGDANLRDALEAAYSGHTGR